MTIVTDALATAVETTEAQPLDVSRFILTPPRRLEQHDAYGLVLGSDQPNVRVGTIRNIYHHPGVGGRWFCNSIPGMGMEADFALVNPEPGTEHYYLGWNDAQRMDYYYVTSTGDWRLLLPITDVSGNVPGWGDHPAQRPAVWIAAHPAPGMPPRQGTPAPVVEFTPGPVVEPERPTWLPLVREARPRDRFNHSYLVVTEAISRYGTDVSDRVGTLRFVEAYVRHHDDRYWFEDENDSQVLYQGAILQSIAYDDTPRLYWPGGDARTGTLGEAQPFIVQYTNGALRQVATAEGVWVPHREVPATGATVVSTYTPPPGRVADVPALREEAQRLEEFWEKWSEAMNDKAVEQQWCGEYEKAVHVLGFDGRNGGTNNWEVEVSFNATITIESPSSRLDLNISQELGFSVETSEVTLTFSATETFEVEDVSEEEARDAIDSSFIEDAMANRYGYTWDVDDYDVLSLSVAETF